MVTAPSRASGERAKLPDGWKRGDVIDLVHAVADLYPDYTDVVRLIWLLTDHQDVVSAVMEPLFEYMGALDGVGDAEDTLDTLAKVLNHVARTPGDFTRLRQVLPEFNTTDAQGRDQEH